MIFVISTLRIKPGTQADVLAAARPCLEGTLKEDGCIGYDLHASVSDPQKLVFVERWESRAHLDAHARAPHFLAWRAAGGPMIETRNVEIIDPASVSTL